MQWFYNQKIGVKLQSSFILMAAIAAIIGWIGTANLRQADKSSTELYEQATLPREPGMFAWISTQMLDALEAGRFASVPPR